MNRARILGFTLSAAIIGMTLAGARTANADEPRQLSKPNTPIEHFVVLMQENHSFDNYFGTYPGADGIPPGTCMPVNPTDATRECVEPFHTATMTCSLRIRTTALRHTAFSRRGAWRFIYAELRNQDGARPWALR
jgi:phospholipase C